MKVNKNEACYQEDLDSVSVTCGFSIQCLTWCSRAVYLSKYSIVEYLPGVLPFPRTEWTSWRQLPATVIRHLFHRDLRVPGSKNSRRCIADSSSWESLHEVLGRLSKRTKTRSNPVERVGCLKHVLLTLDDYYDPYTILQTWVQTGFVCCSGSFFSVSRANRIFSSWLSKNKIHEARIREKPVRQSTVTKDASIARLSLGHAKP